MPYEIKRQESTGLFIVVDTNTGKTLSRADQPSDAINIAIANGTLPADDKQGLLTEARVVVEKENEVQQQKSTAYQTAVDDAAKGPNAPAAQQTSANGRVTPPPDTSSPSNAEPPATTNSGGGDSGTDAPVRTTEQTQATGPASNSGRAIPAPNTAFGQDAAQSGQAQLATNPGTPTNDDAAKNAGAANQNDETNDYTSIKISPRANPLDNYYSYSYSISVYMLAGKQYETLLRSKSKKIDGYFLLFQSGGAGPNVGGKMDGMGSTKSATGVGGGRNPFFGDDFYIDALTVDTLPLGKATGASQMAATMKITVVEPQGMTLIDRLYEAAKNLQQGSGSDVGVNYTATEYLTVIRFYGYDEGGNIVYPIRSLGEDSGSSDPKVVIEKFIPFRLNSINWSVGSKTVVYEWNCVPVGQQIGGSTGRGSVQSDMQLVDSTVGGLLGGDNQAPDATADAERTQIRNTAAARNLRQGGTAAATPDGSDNRFARQGTAPSNAAAAPTAKTTLTQGLMGALNAAAQQLVEDGTFTIADEYSIEFQGIPGVPASAISDATLKPLGQVQNDKAKFASGQTASKDIKSLNQETTTVDSVSESFSITAGQMITQAIDLTIRNSSYIQNQQLVILQTDGRALPNPNARNKPVSWFIITMFATRIGDAIDPLRNDYAYKIKYVVRPFVPSNLNSKYFPVSKFYGIHKRYPYWFTGQNVAVLEYQETLNALYTITVSGNSETNSIAADTRLLYTSNANNIVKYTSAPRSNETSFGQKGPVNEPAANAAEYLFSPGDMRNAKVKIIGDPDWIQQGSLFKEIKEGENKVEVLTGFAPDGSISFETGDVLFEMVWQRPEDYNIDTGLADPYSGAYSGNANTTREAVQSRVYQAVKVVSEFRGGKFEQTLEGTLFLFPKPTAEEGAPGAPSAEGANTVQDPQQRAEAAAAASAAANTTETNSLASRFPATRPATARSVDNSIDASAALLGAQGAFKTGASVGRATIEPGVLATLGPTLLPAGPPLPATSGTGGAIGIVSETIGLGPPKLPQVLSGQTNLSVTQIVGQLTQAAASTGPQRGAVPGTTGGPSTQQIVKDR